MPRTIDRKLFIFGPRRPWPRAVRMWKRQRQPELDAASQNGVVDRVVVVLLGARRAGHHHAAQPGGLDLLEVGDALVDACASRSGRMPSSRSGPSEQYSAIQRL